MATNVIMPALGVAQQTGTLLKWLKAEGQSVTKGEPLMEIETDKATVEIEAPGSGVLTQVNAKAGDEVPVGHRIALLLAPGEALRQPMPVTTRTPQPAPTAEKNLRRNQRQKRFRVRLHLRRTHGRLARLSRGEKDCPGERCEPRSPQRQRP